MSESRHAARGGQSGRAKNSHSEGVPGGNGLSRLFDQKLLFAYLERIAVAIEANRAEESFEALLDRAIGILHRVNYSRRRVARELGLSEATLRGPKWMRFNKVLNDAQSMQRGLDVARMQASMEKDGEGEE